MFRFQSTYIVKVNDDLGSPTYWNARFQDLDLRINATESYAATITTAADEVSNVGLTRINATIQPLIDSITTQITTLTASVTALEALVLTDQNNITLQLNTLLATANTLVANLESLGVVQDGTF
jgi:hypothetical protein